MAVTYRGGGGLESGGRGYLGNNRCTMKEEKESGREIKGDEFEGEKEVLREEGGMLEDNSFQVLFICAAIQKVQGCMSKKNMSRN